MKAIVANTLFGGIFGCLSWTNSTLANPQSVHQASLDIASISSIALEAGYQTILPEVSPILSLVDQIITIYPLTHFSESSSLTKYYSSSGKQAYIYNAEQTDLVLGFQQAFWSGANASKYWGVTTVKQWGETNYRQLKLPQLNYIDSAPVLAAGSSALTFSGGGNKNLAQPNTLKQDQEYSPDFENFRGGVAYHHGVERDLTIGVGLIYEDDFSGFTQLTYDSHILPLQTTFSLIAKEASVYLNSHVLFKPASNLEVNYYYVEEAEQKFDLSWGIASELTLIAAGNTKNDSYSTGLKLEVQNNLFSLSASASLDNQRNWQWKFNSQIGRLKLTYNQNQQKSSSQLNANLFEADTLGLQCAAFVKYQSRIKKEEQQEFVAWGVQLNSATKIRPNQNLWSLELGFGSGVEGKGMNVSGSLALKPNLTLKLDYEEISAVSDETKIKLQLNSQ